MNDHHLTSEEMEALFSDLQAKEPQDRTQHLEVCPQCSAEVESLRGTLEDLRTAATASAEHHRRVAIMPVPSHRTPRMMWTLLAATTLICIAVPLTVYQRHAGVTVVSAPVQPPQTTTATITDEQLWNSIQDDLDSSVPKPMLPLAAASTDSTSSTDNTKEN